MKNPKKLIFDDVTLNQETIHWFQKSISSWFVTHGRHDLPWQEPICPYRVWVSEIMLQQTQVQTVIPYFLRFMQSFPSIKSLAESPLDDVLSHWSGLGYYRRAHHLHHAACQLIAQGRETLPNTLKELLLLPGIGRSTAGAIISLGFQKKATIMDGNVKRVLCRFFAIKQDIKKSSTLETLWLTAEALTPELKANAFNQAMMDMGASVCTRSKPKCEFCPIQSKCKGIHHPTNYPYKSAAKVKREMDIWLLILEEAVGQKIIIEKRDSIGIWAGLWSLPEFESLDGLKSSLPIHLKLDVLPTQKHLLTHICMRIHPVKVVVASKKIQPINLNQKWMTHNEYRQLGIPTPIKRILKQLFH